MSHFRNSIDAMEGYAPGEQPQGKGFIKLNTNESPYPPSTKVLKAMKAAVNSDIRLYPDPMAEAVRRKAAEVFGTKPGRILVGNGSDDLLTMIFRAIVGPKRVVAFPTPTYSLYETLAEIEGSRTKAVPFPDDFSLPEKLFSKGAAATIIANPNSPSGTVVSNAALARLARAIDGVLIVDEAYADFADSNALRLVDRHPNVIVLRTFSKSYSLCGVRLGLAFARENIIDGLAKVKDSYNVNRFAIAAGVAALEDIDVMRDNARRIRRTRARLTESLRDRGWFVYPSQANFIFTRVPAPLSAKELYLRLKAKKILVRYFGKPRLNDCLRISIGSDSEINALLKALDKVG